MAILERLQSRDRSREYREKGKAQAHMIVFRKGQPSRKEKGKNPGQNSRVKTDQHTIDTSADLLRRLAQLEACRRVKRCPIELGRRVRFRRIGPEERHSPGPGARCPRAPLASLSSGHALSRDVAEYRSGITARALAIFADGAVTAVLVCRVSLCAP